MTSITNNKLAFGVLTLIVLLAVGISIMRASDGMAPDPHQSGDQHFGSQTGGDLAPTGYYAIGGINYYSQRVGILASSSMACVMKNPFATSTLKDFSVTVRTNPYIAQTVDLSTTTSGGYGSSSPAYIKAQTLPAGPSNLPWLGNAGSTTNQQLIDRDPLASGNPFAGVSNNVIKPNETLTLRIATSSPATGTFPTGYCDFVFKQL